MTKESATEASRSFAPVSASDAQILILGSLPGVRSLEEARYYAQPRNVFWKIMGALFEAAPELPYQTRLQRLRDARIALWDVVAAAVRPGSLDAHIRRETIEVNDFEGFLRRHRSISLICCNGRTAGDLFRRRVLPGLSMSVPSVVVLPSTSPAHAAMSYEEKLRQWRAALTGPGRPS